MSTITKINAYEILASGGLPTIECRVETEDGFVGVASVPYGASAGVHESVVLLDKDMSRFCGNGMQIACRNINEVIAPKILGFDIRKQREIDKVMIEADGTLLKSKLGGNAILAVSMAVARAAATCEGKELYEYLKQTFMVDGHIVLPKPMMVMIEGGKHADKSTDFQEYLVDVTYSAHAIENVRVGCEIYMSVKKVLKDAGFSVNVGSEGAFAPEGIENNRQPLEILAKGIELAGYKLGQDAFLSLDVAASEFYSDGKYFLKRENRTLDSSELLSCYEEFCQNFPILSIEDGFAEDDWDSWNKMHEKLVGQTRIVGDDLTVTNVERLKMAIEKQTIDAILIKLNQAGSVTETIDTCLLAKKHNFMVIPSHRGGGESNDTFMVDLAVAVGGDFIKVGPTRGERVSKYNRLMEIERLLI